MLSLESNRHTRTIPVVAMKQRGDAVTTSTVDLPQLFDLDYCAFSDDFLFYENLPRRCYRPLFELRAAAGRSGVGGAACAGRVRRGG